MRLWLFTIDANTLFSNNLTYLQCKMPMLSEMFTCSGLNRKEAIICVLYG
jgi:hypothetical protein